jgi:FlaA1/EpsC-like NDP-sugar epimerase
VQLFLFLTAGTVAFLLRFDFRIPRYYFPHWETALWVWALTKFIAFALLGLDRGWWRFASIYDVSRLAVGNLLGTSVSAIVIRWIAPPGFPRSIYILDLLLCFVVTVVARVTARVMAEAFRLNLEGGKKRRTLIYGAGNAGVSLLQEIRRNPSLPYEVVGFLDDNPQKAGLVIYGARVLGRGASLGITVKRCRVENVLIAIPSASGAQMT